MLGLKRGTVQLADHQDEWMDEAENTIRELKKILGDTAVDIQHVGSTAVPLIRAKPIIDIVIGVRDLNDIRQYIAVLDQNGFVFRGEDVPGQVLFVKGNFEQDVRTHHIHAVKANGDEWNHYIDFRDYLNAFPEKASMYNECKRHLADRFSTNRKRYTEGKKEIIDTLIEEAAQWRIDRLRNKTV